MKPTVNPSWIRSEERFGNICLMSSCIRNKCKQKSRLNSHLSKKFPAISNKSYIFHYN